MVTKGPLMVIGLYKEDVPDKVHLQDMDPKGQILFEPDPEVAMRNLKDLNTPLPALIILNIGHPDDGVSYIQSLKSDSNLKLVPVIAFGEDHDTRNINAYYASGIAGYIFKPGTEEAWAEIIHAMNAYWTLSLLPNRIG